MTGKPPQSFNTDAILNTVSLSISSSTKKTMNVKSKYKDLIIKKLKDSLQVVKIQSKSNQFIGFSLHEAYLMPSDKNLYHIQSPRGI